MFVCTQTLLSGTHQEVNTQLTFILHAPAAPFPSCPCSLCHPFVAVFKLHLRHTELWTTHHIKGRTPSSCPLSPELRSLKWEDEMLLEDLETSSSLDLKFRFQNLILIQHVWWSKQTDVSRLGFGAYRYDWAMQMKRNHSFLIKSKVLNLTTVFNLQSYFLINRFLFSFNILVSRFKVDFISRIVLCVLCVYMCLSSLCFSDLENIHVITLIRLWSVYWSTTYHR